MSTSVGIPEAKSQQAPAGTRESIEVALAASLAPDRLYRLSVEQYDQMARAGILTKNDRIELIEDLLVHKQTKYPKHIVTTNRIFRAIGPHLPEGWLACKEDPIRLARSEPEPDVAVIRGGIEDSFYQKPQTGDVTLVVEVADSSYPTDFRERLIYAEAGIPVYWIANLNADRIEVYTEPTGAEPAPEYRLHREYALEAEIPLVIDGRAVARFAVKDLLLSAPSS